MKTLHPLILFLLAAPFAYGQKNDDAKIAEITPPIQVVQAYFHPSKLDSAFVVQNKISAIRLNELRIEHDTVRYNKPILDYRFDAKGKRTHTENNVWSATGGATRFSDDYGDSVKSVQHEKYQLTDGYLIDSKFCQNNYRINDTLTRIVRMRYHLDSLMGMEDFIFDSHAEKRERQKAIEKITDTNTQVQTVVVIDRSNQRDCIIPSEYPVFPQDPKPAITKDKLGRIIEVFSSTFVNIDEQLILVPSKSTAYTYYKETNILVSCNTYLHFNYEKFKKALNEKVSEDAKPIFPTCFLPECRSYQFLAENFTAGIPEKITVTNHNGTSKTNYTTTFTFR
ncbi:MAG: hypothetical protein WC044_02265 [Crocinitomicaceae bacterium]